MLFTPGGAPGETSWVMGTHAGRPVTAILQRPTTPRSPGQGEAFIFDPTTGRRVTIGAYPRSGQIPGSTASFTPPAQSAATVVTQPFARPGGPVSGSGSLAAGYSEEMAVEGRVGSSLSVREAQTAGAVTLLGAVESVRVPLGAVTIPSAMESSIRTGTPTGTPVGFGTTLGGPQAAAGSARDWRLGLHAISRFDPQTGTLRPPGSPSTVPDPSPRGVRSASSPGSQVRAAAHLNMSIDALENTILQGMVVNGVVLVTSMADLERIGERTREYLQQHYGRTR